MADSPTANIIIPFENRDLQARPAINSLLPIATFSPLIKAVVTFVNLAVVITSLATFSALIT